MKLIKFLTSLIISILITNQSYGIENKIILKIGNEIITSYDIQKEANYLSSLNPNIKNLSNDQIYTLSKNSLIRYKIKQNEILKNFDNYEVDRDVIDQFIENIINKNNLNSKKEFFNHIKKNKLSIDYIEKKISMEVLWNRLIYIKYYSKVKTDNKKIKEQIKKNNKLGKKQVFLQEILFEIKENENINSKYKILKKSIDEEGFEKTALLYSLSETSKNSGNIGWVDANSLNKNILKEVNKLNIGESTNPITIPGGFLILKLKNTRIEREEINIEEEIKKIVQNKINEQLNQYSLIYYNKIKKNININEL